MDHIRDEIIITYKLGTSEEDLRALEEKYSLKFIKEFRLTNSFYYKIQTTEEALVLKKKIEENDFVKIVTLNKSLIPNSLNLDLGFSKQWYMENTGQEIRYSSGHAGIDIGWKRAMELYSKKAQSFVAVLDSGFAEDHDEIKHRNAINSEEFYGIFGEDDDNNGYIDDIYGWNFIDDQPYPYDFFGHGTQISSIISGANDGLGMQGISPDTYIFPLKVFEIGDDGKPRPNIASVVEALNYVYYKPNIRVANLSFGAYYEDELLALTIDHFDRDNRVLLICSAGNGGYDQIGDDNDAIERIPSSLTNDCIISVASIDSKGNLSEFSNYGKTSVDLAAPGENIYSATIEQVAKEFYTIDPYSWTQSFNWSESPLSWHNNELYQESSLYRSPSFLSPITLNSYVSELTNFGDPIDISGSIMPQLRLLLNYSISGNSAVILVASDIGLGPYQKKYTFKGTTGTIKNFRFSFDEFRGSEKLFLKFVFVKLEPLDFFHLGTPTLFDLDVDNYSGVSNYSFVNGTSFSAPIVAAIASLLFSHRPDLLASDVKKIILDSVKPLNSLSGRVLSGGTVRADNALSEANNYRERVKLELTASSYDQELVVSSNGIVTQNSNYGSSDVGRLLGGGWYFKGDNVTIDAHAKDGWIFGGWSNWPDGDSDHTLTINNDLSLRGIFVPNMSDEDNDSLEYYYEIAFGTDPNKFDSDGDSIGDGDEIIAYFNGQNLSPTIDNSEIVNNLEQIFGRNAFNMGEQSVLNNPSAYNLFTSEQYQDALQSLDRNATPYTRDWFYMPERGWMWTKPKIFPWLYDKKSSNWMYFKSGHDNPRFFHYGTKEWMTLD